MGRGETSVEEHRPLEDRTICFSRAGTKKWAASQAGTWSALQGWAGHPHGAHGHRPSPPHLLIQPLLWLGARRGLGETQLLWRAQAAHQRRPGEKEPHGCPEAPGSPLVWPRWSVSSQGRPGSRSPPPTAVSSEPPRAPQPQPPPSGDAVAPSFPNSRVLTGPSEVQDMFSLVTSWSLISGF